MKRNVVGWVFSGCLAVIWTGLGTVCINSAAAQPSIESQSVTRGDEPLADRYFFEAKAKAAELKWLEAYDLLERAWKLKHSHDIAGNLGQVALKLGRYKKAATFLDRCLRLFPPTGNTEQRTQIQTLLDSARVHVAAVQLHIAPQRGEIVLDRITVLGPVGSQPELLYVDPGMHVVQVRDEGRILAEQSFVAVANSSHDVNVFRNDGSSSNREPKAAAASLDGASRNKPSNKSPAVAPGSHSSAPLVIGAAATVASFVTAGFSSKPGTTMWRLPTITQAKSMVLVVLYPRVRQIAMLCTTPTRAPTITTIGVTRCLPSVPQLCSQPLPTNFGRHTVRLKLQAIQCQ